MRDAANPKPCPTDLASPDARLVAMGHDLAAAWAGLNALDGDTRTDAEEGRWQAAYNTCSTIVDDMQAIQPHTLEGFAAKAMAVAWCFGFDPIDYNHDEQSQTADMRLTGSIIKDLLGLGLYQRPDGANGGQVDV